jgi:hypothetical protein
MEMTQGAWSDFSVKREDAKVLGYVIVHETEVKN